MSKINYKADGFLKKPEYSFYFPEVFKKYEENFGHAEVVQVNLSEMQYSMLNQQRASPINISEDGKTVVINYTDTKYYDAKGKEKSTPTPESVLESLKFLLEKGVKEYLEKFPS